MKYALIGCVGRDWTGMKYALIGCVGHDWTGMKYALIGCVRQDWIGMKYCCRGECLGTTTCLEGVVGRMQDHAPSKILLLLQILFFASIKFHGDHETVTWLR